MTAAIWASETASLKLSSVTIVLLTQSLPAALHAPKARPGTSIAKQSMGWVGENNVPVEHWYSLSPCHAILLIVTDVVRKAGTFVAGSIVKSKSFVAS
jgi:hypothetical protein